MADPRPRCPACRMPMRGTIAIKRGHVVAREFGEPRCNVCDLVGMTSQHVRWDDDEDRGYDAEGESINAVEHWTALDHLREDPSFLDRCNSTLESPATSHWEPLVLIRVPGPVSHRNGVPIYNEEIRAFPTGLDAWRGAGIGTNAAGEVIWNEEEDHMDPVTEGA